MASLTATYLLWLFGGLFGLHHLYLGRPRHAFVWYATLGGVFGLGWIREFWQLPNYVRSSNDDGEYRFYKACHTRIFPRPVCGIPRFCGMLVMGFLFKVMLCGLMPISNEKDCVTALYKCLYIALTVAGSSFGVHLVANVGEMESSWQYSVLGSLLSFPWLRKSAHNSNLTVVLSTLVTWMFGLYWKPDQSVGKNRRSKAGLFLLAAIVWTCLVYYVLFFDQSVIVSKNNLNVAIGNVFLFPAWDRWEKLNFFYPPSGNEELVSTH